jgi:NADPH:quinone reductase-like Zn-dependent oxidoreductase
MRRGLMAKVFPIGFPRILGRDCAGEFQGGLVAGVSDPRTDGTHAEYALLPAEQTAPIPEGLSPEEAASLCVTGISAYIALVENARVSGGHRVLVHAGAGGVGSVAIQIARQLGCEVFATASPRTTSTAARSARRRDRLPEPGLHHRDAALRRDPRHHRRDTHRRSLKMLKPGGTVVALAAEPIPKGSNGADVRDTMVNVRPTRERLLQIFQWAPRGSSSPRSLNGSARRTRRAPTRSPNPATQGQNGDSVLGGGRMADIDSRGRQARSRSTPSPRCRCSTRCATTSA